MANPNIVNVTEIYGQTVAQNLANTNAILIANNPAGSGKILKINSLIASNYTTDTNVALTVNHYSEDDIGGTATQIINSVTVPFKASLVVIDKGTSIYLEEDMSLGCTAGASNSIKIVCSYEEIS